MERVDLLGLYFSRYVVFTYVPVIGGRDSTPTFGVLNIGGRLHLEATGLSRSVWVVATLPPESYGTVWCNDHACLTHALGDAGT